MAQKTDVELLAQISAVIKANGNREITPALDSAIRNNVVDSKVNKNGGLILLSLLGYTTDLTPTDDKHLTPKKYVDDIVTSGAYDDTPVFYLDGSRALTGPMDAGNQNISNIDDLIVNDGGFLRNTSSNAYIRLTGAGNIELDGTSLVGNRILELDASNILVTIAKGTAYNKNFGTAVGDVLQGGTSIVLPTATTLTVASDENATTILGRAKIASPVADVMYIGHFDHCTATDYAIAHNAAGAVVFNTASGQNMFFSTGNTTRLTLSTALLTYAAVGISMTNIGAAPGSVTDTFRMYGADVVAGNAAPHFVTENGGIIKIYRETGWTLPTGTPSKAGFDTSTATLTQVAETVKAIMDYLLTNTGHLGS